MSFAITRADLEASFGPEHLVVIPPDRLNQAVTHPATRRFLADVGMPDQPDFLYEPQEYLTSGLPAARSVEPELDNFEGLPGTADSWVFMGYCYGNPVILDGSTGHIHALPEGELHSELINSSIDLFALFLNSLYRDFDYFDEGTSLTSRQQAADNLTVELRSADPAAFSDPEGFWYRLLEGLTMDYFS